MQILKDLLHLVFPEICVACDSLLISQERWVCFSCLSQIEETHFHESFRENELYDRFAGKVAIGGAAACFYFDKKGRLQEVLRALKYKDLPQVGVFLGEYYGHILKGSDFIGKTDQVIPVPLHRSRYRRRGYNQAEKIGEGLSSVLDIPLARDVLRRSRKTQTQTRKSRSERWENVEEAFECIKAPGKHILLVDDVITTGSTIEACVRALEAAASPPDSIKLVGVGIARSK